MREAVSGQPQPQGDCMKQRIPLISLVFLMSFVSMSWADHPRWHQRDRTVITLETHRNIGHRHGHGGYHHRQDARAWSPLAAVAILGSTLYFANTYSQPPVSTVIVTPPVVYSPPRAAYFCQTSQQYYPYVPVCQVPWQVINY